MPEAFDSVVSPRGNNDEQKSAKNPVVAFITNPTVVILVAAILGFGIGYGISDGRVDDVVVSWIALPGNLFLRALKCVVLPLVFVNIILAVVDMLNVGKAVSIGWKTIAMYTFTTMLAAIEGLVCVLIFQPYFDPKDQDPVKTPIMAFACNATANEYMFQTENNSVVCQEYTGDLTSTNESSGYQFLLKDLNSVLDTSSSGPKNDISISQTIQDGIFRKMVPSNITADFMNANFVGVLAFAIVFAVASQNIPVKKGQSLRVLDICHEMNLIFLNIINWVIALTPIAVVSLVSGALGSQSDLSTVFSDIGVLMAATLTAMAFHVLITYPTLFYVVVRKNPFSYIKVLVPAQTFAFASASSAATLPVTMKCVASSGEVPSSIANFVLSLGATINMDGGAIYFPTAIIFLAVSSGLEDKIDGVAYFLIVLLSTIGSAGTAPVPSASLVLIITAFNTVFDSTGTPSTFSYILAVDWFMDRCRTMLNVTGDAVMARVVAEMAGDMTEMVVNDEERMSVISDNIGERLSYKHSIVESKDVTHH